jgi:hypothetical protein
VEKMREPKTYDCHNPEQRASETMQKEKKKPISDPLFEIDPKLLRITQYVGM